MAVFVPGTRFDSSGAHPPASSTPTKTTATTSVPTSTTTSAPSATPASTAKNYTIAAGDTLSGIAAKNGTSVANLLSLNPSITDPNKIYAGRSLVLNAATPVANATTAAKLASPASTDLTSSSGTERLNEVSLGKKITDAGTNNTTYSPNYSIDYFDNYIEKLNQRFQQETQNINAQFDAMKSSTEKLQAGETAAMSAGIARMGGYLGGSASGTGVLLNLAQNQRTEMLSLESKRMSALSEARTAYEDKSYEIARAKMQEVKDIEAESYRRQQDYIAQVQKAEKAIAEQNQQIDIYNAMQQGATDPVELFKQLGGAVPLETINKFLEQSTPKAANGALVYTPSQTARLLGAGLSSKDIKVAQSYINENGYTDEFRKQLTASQRLAFDDVYREKAKGTGVGGDLTISEAKSLGLPVSLIGRSQEQVIADLRRSTPPMWYEEYLTGGWADQNAEVNPAGLNKQWNEFRNQVISQFQTGNDYSVKSGSSGGGGSVSFDQIPD